jgi:hypothetical protein
MVIVVFFFWGLIVWLGTGDSSPVLTNSRSAQHFLNMQRIAGGLSGYNMERLPV